MLIDRIKKKWQREREILGYVKLEYGRLIDLFIKDLGEIRRNQIEDPDKEWEDTEIKEEKE